MENTPQTPQEKAWSGEFGNEYHRRSPGNVNANRTLFERVFQIEPMPPIRTILELGAGTGANVQALQQCFPRAKITAVEVNTGACEELKRDSPDVNVINMSVLDWKPDGQWDLVLTKGLLIHIAPLFLPAVYNTIMKAAGRWILLAEYYNPTPVAIPYHGEPDRLWKRDFAGEMLDRYPDQLVLEDYGFTYHRDASCPQDDLNWFLLCKQ